MIRRLDMFAGRFGYVRFFCVECEYVYVREIMKMTINVCSKLCASVCKHVTLARVSV